MKQTWLQRVGHPHVLLFFAGWAMDERPFRRLRTGRYDVCVCHDYRGLAPGLPEPLFHGAIHHEHDVAVNGWLALGDAYEKITVVGWSFGCAVAARVMAGARWRVREALAINGTVVPEHEELGIPGRWLDATARNMLNGGWPKFVRRMCSATAARQDFQAHCPQRDLAGSVAELEELRRLSAPTVCGFSRALVGSEDKIILPRNQRCCWEKYGIAARTITAPHYPFHLWESWEDVLDA